LLDFIENATSRATSLWQLLAIFFVYSVFIVGLPITAVAWVASRLVTIGSWPGMTSIAVVAAASGLTIIMRRFQRQEEARRHRDSHAEDRDPEEPDAADGRAENDSPAAEGDDASQ